ncbi:hypothetical protein [Micromonospora sp. WMMD1155]|uniref:hypothetical protein n=1 Tax=Micromonospora sp. WMMD1155 TaxID=3016094 RepID=UPI00249B28CC|nr:hypothetical protein [Micromonospora sp. WMMD1155]WFE52156.1 hypothetical protein O7617_18300 [Micromonospora sp. WMMD1155]
MRRLWTPAWIARHMAMVVLTVGFLGLGWWQVSRAAAGNSLSWGYAVEWPIFAGFVVYVWWREVKLARRRAVDADAPPVNADTDSEIAPEVAGSRPTVRRPVRVARMPVGGDAVEDTDLAAYNHYLSWLNANPGARPGDYPG